MPLKCTVENNKLNFKWTLYHAQFSVCNKKIHIKNGLGGEKRKAPVMLLELGLLVWDSREQCYLVPLEGKVHGNFTC